MNDIQEALDAIRKAQTNPAGRHWLDVAESFLKRALSSPHPEAREEDLKIIRQAIIELSQAIRSNQSALASWSREGLAALARLAAPKPEGQTLTFEQVGWLRMVLGRALYRVEHFPGQSNDDDIEADELARAIILLGGEPAAPEPRPAEEPFVSVENPDTHLVEIHVNPNYSEPAPSEEDAEYWKEEARRYCQNANYWRSQLARKDEALARIERMTTRGDIKEIARASLREPDGRKGE